MADITMPQLGETVTEGTVTRWLKAVGDQVAEDEVLFEVSTDKVDSEVPSPAAGYLSEILVAEGQTVDVGVTLAVITAAQPAAARPPVASGTPTAGPAADLRPEPQAATGPAPAAEAASEPAPAGSLPPAERPPGTLADTVLSPVVRRLLSEHDLDPADIAGTGTGGRVTRADVLARVDAGNGGQSPAGAPLSSRGPASRGPSARGPAARGPATVAGPAAPAPPGERDEVIAFTNIRRRTAEHMVRSKATSAHTLSAMEVDFEGIERTRRAAKERFRAEEGVNLTYLPFVALALSDALREFPHLNASVGDDALVVHRDVHLGIAVDLGGEGLIVPVIHDAGGKRLRALATEAAELAERARSRRLSADDIAGGTFTITNPGPFGTFLTIPIINQPQVAILSTDGVKRRPVVVALADGSEGIAIHSVGILALSFDHRAVDGAYASRFLARLKEIVETRDWVQEL